MPDQPQRRERQRTFWNSDGRIVPLVLKDREAARRMGLRWLRRRSQNSRISWEAYNNYLRHHPLPNPNRGLGC